MQAQRSTLHPIPETFDLENMSDQSNVNVESHIYPGELTNRMDSPSLPDYQVAGSSSICNFRNVGSHASGSSSFVNGWATGSGGNSDIPADHGCTAEDKMVIGWNQVSNVQLTSRFDERQAVDTHVPHSENESVDVLNNQVMDDRLHLHPSCNYGTTSDGNPYNFTANQTPVANEGQPYMDLSCCPHPTQLVGSESEQVPFTRSSAVGCMPENINGRANHPMDGRRGSCKRKTVENISGSSSLDALPCPSQWDDGHLRLTAPGRHSIGSSLSISATTATIPVRPVEEPVIPRASVGDAGPDFRGLSMVGQSEAPQRTVRARHNPPHQQDPSLPHIWPCGNAGRYMPDLQPNSSHSRRLFSGDQSADTGPAGVSTSAQLRQPSMFHVPSGIQRSLHSVGWNESSIPRLDNASSSNAGARERSSSQQEEASSRNMMMGIPSNTWFVAGSENRTTNHDSGNWVPVNRNSNGPGDIASSMLHPLPSMPWGSHHVPFTQAPRRSGGVAQGQGLASSVSRASQGVHFHPSRVVHSSSSSDMPVPPVSGLQVPQYLRSALLMERQGDGLVGVPFGSLQAIAAEGDGRNRIMTEIRNVLELVRSRRGENLRFEDILILDQSAFYAAADVHDQHRDMRLDVDNMTYEELLDLEERIGNVSTGLSEEMVSKCLKRSVYFCCIESSADEAYKKQPEDELCSICREEYQDTEELGILDCGHIHHSDCIRKWLLLKNLCPICKKTALNV